MDAGRFAHGTDGRAGDDAGTRTGRQQDDVGGAEVADAPACEIVLPSSGTVIMLRSPSLVAFSTAGGTSFALA